MFGPSGSGKTHLLSILKNKTTTLKVEAKALSEDIFFHFKTKEAIIIENLNEKISENILFSLWNTALQDNKYLLITSIKPISEYKFKLPDLNSRVSSSVIIGLNLGNEQGAW